MADQVTMFLPEGGEQTGSVHKWGWTPFLGTSFLAVNIIVFPAVSSHTSSQWILESTSFFLTHCLQTYIAGPSSEWGEAELVIWVRKAGSEWFSFPSQVLPQQVQCHWVQVCPVRKEGDAVEKEETVIVPPKPKEARQPRWACRPGGASQAKKGPVKSLMPWGRDSVSTVTLKKPQGAERGKWGIFKENLD